jgi:ribosomal protein S27AE
MAGGNVMELRTASSGKQLHSRLQNYCAQCGEAIFLPEWSEYLDRHRVRHLWQCEACGYKFETLVSFPEA